MGEKKRGFWSRLFGKKRPSTNMPPEHPLVVPKIELSPDRSWSIQAEHGAVDAVYLRQQMSNYLTLAQLDEFAEEFGLATDELQGGKGRRVMLMINAVSEQNRLPELLKRCEQRFPDVNWQLDDAAPAP